MFSTSTAKRGSRQVGQSRATPINAARPHICSAPSPLNANTGRSGCATLAACAYGIAEPMVASVPDSDASMPAWICRSRAYQTVDEPESPVRIASAGSRGDRSTKRRRGFSGRASRSASSVAARRDSAIHAVRSRRQAPSAFSSSSGSSAASVAAASPSSSTSIG